MTDVQKFFSKKSNTLRDVIAVIDNNEKGIAVVVDDNERLLATITDGDIRRALLAGLSLDDSVDASLRLRDAGGPYRPVSASSDSSDGKLLEIMRQEMVAHVPLVSGEGRVVRVVSRLDLAESQSGAPQAVVMTGGLGQRMRPLTDSLPKPMLPLAGKPILEHTIARLKAAGISHVSFTTHYRGDVIEDHFGDGARHDMKFSYFNEDEPLGTAGSIGHLDSDADPLLVINGDIVTGMNVEAMFAFHEEQTATLTVAVKEEVIKFPFGVITQTDGIVSSIDEKPESQVFINAGIYLLSREARLSIPRDRKYDMTDLIADLIKQGKRVACFPIHEYWIDIGQMSDYEKAQLDHAVTGANNTDEAE